MSEKEEHPANPHITEVIEEQYGSMYRVALSVVGNPSDAQDATQDASMQLMLTIRSRGNLLSDEERRSFSRQTTRSRSIDLVRRETPLQKATVPFEETRSLPIYGGDVAEQAEQNETKAKVWDAINQLPTPQREVVIMNHIYGIPHSEIAKEIEIPLGTVKGRLRLGMKNLRMALRGYYE